MESWPRLLLGGACALYVVEGCGPSFAPGAAEIGGAGGAPPSSAGTSAEPKGGAPSQGGSQSGNGGRETSGGEDGSGGEVGSGGEEPSGVAGANMAAGGSPGEAPCVVDPDGDGSCVGAIAAGNYSTCAIRDQGSVRCWGYNGSYRLGDGVPNHEACSAAAGDCSTVPVSVAGVTDARFLSGGANSFCMLSSLRKIWCWGWDVTNGTVIGAGSVAEFGEFTARTVSLRFPLGALDDDGRIWMAGYDDQGRGVFGDGPTAAGTSREFAAIPELEGVSALDVGWRHSCAVLASKAVACWGKGANGEIGDGYQQDRHTPTPVAWENAEPVLAVAVGDGASCALGESGHVWCWGANDRGQLGSLGEGASFYPVPVQGVSDAVELDAGFNHACARRASGNVVCWGNDDNGQLGDAAEHPSCSASVTEPCSRAPVEVSELGDAVAISLGAQHSCALRATGDVVCWGGNGYGQLGDGTFDDAATPVDVNEL